MLLYLMIMFNLQRYDKNLDNQKLLLNFAAEMYMTPQNNYQKYATDPLQEHQRDEEFP